MYTVYLLSQEIPNDGRDVWEEQGEYYVAVASFDTLEKAESVMLDFDGPAIVADSDTGEYYAGNEAYYNWTTTLR